MAEAWANALHPDRLEAYSAGIETHGLNPQAVKVMKAVGIDMSSHWSQLIDDFDLESFDYIVTVCDHAHESCPMVPPDCRVIHKSFEDPPRLAANLQRTEERLACYSRVRDEIRLYVQALPKLLLEEREQQ